MSLEPPLGRDEAGFAVGTPKQKAARDGGARAGEEGRDLMDYHHVAVTANLRSLCSIVFAQVATPPL